MATLGTYYASDVLWFPVNLDLSMEALNHDGYFAGRLVKVKIYLRENNDQDCVLY